MKKKIKPQTIPVVQFAEFLLYLRNSQKLKGSTITCYLFVIETVQDPATKMKLTMIPKLHVSIKCFKHDQIQ